jgi:hypothetical protein
MVKGKAYKHTEVVYLSWRERIGHIKQNYEKNKELILEFMESEKDVGNTGVLAVDIEEDTGIIMEFLFPTLRLMKEAGLVINTKQNNSANLWSLT